MIHRRIDIYARRCICGFMHALAFETLADPTRLRIVEVLLGGERPVNDIVAEVAIHQSGVSRHLRILTDAGFVQVRPKGQQRLYSLRAEPFREIDVWMAKYRKLWEARLDRMGAALLEKQNARNAQKEKP